MTALLIVAGLVVWAGLSALIVTFIHGCEVSNGADW